MKTKRMRVPAGILALCGSVLAMLSTVASAAALQPYVLAYSTDAALQAETDAVVGKLTGAGFEVIGQYSPYDGTVVIGVTSDALKQAAAATEMGGFAAAEHVALTSVNGAVQVSYLNPPYMAAAYRLKTDLADVAAAMTAALGAEKTFGTEKGRDADDLQKFHYMVGMEYFDDTYKLGSYGSYEDAVKAVEANLEKNVGGAAKVYRVDVPGKQQTVFGVSRAKVGDERANDRHIMQDVVDASFDIKTSAYLPYQMMVNGKDVVALHMRFRMAVWHPDLTMVTFGKLMSSPGAIEELLDEVAGGDAKKDFSF